MIVSMDKLNSYDLVSVIGPYDFQVNRISDCISNMKYHKNELNLTEMLFSWERGMYSWGAHAGDNNPVEAAGKH